MTRIEKWQSYRDEIARQSGIGEAISKDKEKIEQYTQEINNINPGILKLSNNEVALESGVSNVKIEQTKIASEISEMFSNINIAKNVINDENVETLFHQMKNESISENHEFKKDFLETSEQYEYFEQNAAEFLTDKEDHETTKQLEQKFNTLNSKAETSKIEPMTLFSNNNQKQASHYVFVISVAVSAFLLAIVIALFVARLVLK